jgi:hypothetical protein
MIDQKDIQKILYKNDLANQLAFWMENNSNDSGLPSMLKTL